MHPHHDIITLHSLFTSTQSLAISFRCALFAANNFFSVLTWLCFRFNTLFPFASFWFSFVRLILSLVTCMLHHLRLCETILLLTNKMRCNLFSFNNCYTFLLIYMISSLIFLMLNSAYVQIACYKIMLCSFHLFIVNIQLTICSVCFCVGFLSFSLAIFRSAHTFKCKNSLFIY